MMRFQSLMDKHIEARQHRFHLAAHQRNTTRQWDLIAAAAEDASIEFFGLGGKEANKNEREIEDHVPATKEASLRRHGESWHQW